MPSFSFSQAVTGGVVPDGDKLSLILKDWVCGLPIPTIANKFFHVEGKDDAAAITKCGQNLFGKLTQMLHGGLVLYQQLLAVKLMRIQQRN